MTPKPVALALALTMALAGCTAPGAPKQAFGEDPAPAAVERLAQRRAALEKDPDDIEAGKDLARDGVTLEREILQSIRAKIDAGDEQGALAATCTLSFEEQ